jgi:hypothetical protein
MNHHWLLIRHSIGLPIAVAACMAAALGTALPATAADRMVLCEEFTNTG